MSLIWLMRGERGTESVSFCLSLSLSLFNLVTGWTRTAAEMKREKDQRLRKNSLSCLSNSFHKESKKRMNKEKKKSNDGNWNASSVG